MRVSASCLKGLFQYNNVCHVSKNNVRRRKIKSDSSESSQPQSLQSSAARLQRSSNKRKRARDHSLEQKRPDTRKINEDHISKQHDTIKIWYLKTDFDSTITPGEMKPWKNREGKWEAGVKAVMWKQSAEENGLNKQHLKCCWELCVDVRTCGRRKMCRSECLCVVIYSAINNLTCFSPSFLPGWSRAVGVPPLLLLRFIILIICLQLLHTFPTGAWMMSKHFKQMLLLIFLMAPLKITLWAANRCNYFNINISGLSRRRLVKTGVRSRNAESPKFMQRRKDMQTTRED